jgi:hypothetical protein
MLRGGGTHSLSEDWTFPENVYVLATMNSVDKAALPLDSALTRRFHRIEMMPNLDFLAEKLDVDLVNLAEKAKSIRDNSVLIDTLSAEETTVLLLDRINILIATDMGEDFELGQALVWGVVNANEDERWAVLISTWDHVLLPQLIERYAGRNDALQELLKVAAGSPTSEAFYERVQIGAVASTNAPLRLKPLRHLGQLTAVNILRQLAI